MKRALALLLLTAAALAAQATGSSGSTTNSAAKTAAKKSTAAPQPPAIPADAVLNADGTYSWKDPQGKNWTLVKTPFGVMRNETATAPSTTTNATSLVGVKAFDEGDKVRFERPTPFGSMKWEKKKTELTDDERSLANSQNITTPNATRN